MSEGVYTESMTGSLGLVSVSLSEGWEQEEAEDEDSWSPQVWVVLLIVFIIIGVTNIVGNMCTLIAYVSDPKLRTISNYYICNLAVTDLVIGLTSIPAYSVYTLEDYQWPLGPAVCKAWLVVDFLMCAESSFTIILISLDRLLMVKLGPGLYPKHVTSKRTMAAIASSWVLAFSMYGPAIIGMDIWRGYSTVEEGDCDVEFAETFLFILITSLLEFCVPFICVTTFNALLYLDIHKRSTQSSLTSSASKAKNLERDRRAARNLFILVVAFFICWTPYTVSTVVYSICDQACIDLDMYELFNWLLWVNSSLNPFLYAYANLRIRAHFKRLLCPFLKKAQPQDASRTDPYVVPHSG